MRTLKILLLVIIVTVLGCEEPTQELLAKSYSPDSLEREICSREKTCAKFADATFFIDGGFLFSYSHFNWVKTYRRLGGAVQIIDYKGQPVVLNKSGQIFSLARTKDQQDRWVDIGNDAASIDMAGDDLISVTKNKGEVWRYAGKPGPVKWDQMLIYMSIPMSCGQNCTTMMMMPLFVPMANGHKVAFSPTRYQGVTRVKSFDGRTMLVDAQGREEVYQP